VAGSGGVGSDDHGQQRIAVTDGSRESQPSGLELLPDLPPRNVVLGGPGDRSATGRRGGGPGLRAGIAGGVSSHPAAARPGPPAGRGVQQAASPLCADPVGALVPFDWSDPVGAFGPLSAPHDNRFPETVGRRRGIVGPLGRRTMWSGGPFPARWAGLGERLARRADLLGDGVGRRLGG
jgi:hypothetical protein